LLKATPTIRFGGALLVKHPRLITTLNLRRGLGILAG
jgi:hypothetical protein